MPGVTPPGSPPPEVPEEFAAAYRAAYERALAAQSDQATHRGRAHPSVPVGDRGEVPQDGFADVAVRSGRLRIGTHRARLAKEDEDDGRPPWSERVTRSRWLVPLLLVVLVLLLVLGAYSVGRRFAGQISSGTEPRTQPQVTAHEPVTSRGSS